MGGKADTPLEMQIVIREIQYHESLLILDFAEMTIIFANLVESLFSARQLNVMSIEFLERVIPSPAESY